MPTPDDTVTLTVGGQMISGWTSVAITRGCERIPNSFELGLTSTNPNDGSQVVAYAGQTCSVQIGSDTVVTGYVDRDTNGGDANGHALSIIGRGKCADLVDCAAVYKGGQISGSEGIQIASKLAAPYGITVKPGPGLDIERPIPQFNLDYGESAQEIIERICSYSGLLYYENEKGDLLFAEVGASNAASGFAYGQNVQSWSVVNSMDQRFSDYVCVPVSVASFEDTFEATPAFIAYDKNVPRYRNTYLVAQSVSNSFELCQIRALWEAARRAGRGTTVTLTADSWRDSAGTLWTPNTLAPVTLPGLRQGPNTMLCISEVTFRYDDAGGKIADIVLLPSSAFAPEPIQIQPVPLATNESKPTVQSAS